MIISMIQYFLMKLKCQKGQDVVEYALILGIFIIAGWAIEDIFGFSGMKDLLILIFDTAKDITKERAGL